MQIIISTFFVLALLQAPELTKGEDFGYDGNIGPTHWGERYRECTGKHQSPININVLRVKQVTLPDIEFVGFDDSIDDVHVTNNGHTVLIEVDNEPHPRVRGGPLEGDYIFSQMHFHWGDNDTFGSEDKINHRSFPMELHMVFYKDEYRTAKEAVKHSDGLAVLAFFYELDRHQHPAYDDITSALANVTEPHATVVMSNPFSFLNILPYDLRRYFTYRGSLTTPPCSEVVTWLDFEQPVRLAHEQIELFRELKSAHGKIRHNFRPIQPIGDRVVFYNIDNNYFSYNELDDPSEETTTTRPRRRGKGNGAGSAKLFLSLMFLSSTVIIVL
ncbi:putative carbonic anhydrase 3 [Leguminivora glycinivorella]|uniref:putative carbonic anhydrase 3 n=1 Tax=Leguminivora glycinivorella TaxID=1035111 RepID=UPI00200D0FA0|nr:putative carbonic anhydrase 3 [Leguminivora glycinivorella]